MKSGGRARARVRVTLIVDAGSTWDGDHTLSQVAAELWQDKSAREEGE